MIVKEYFQNINIHRPNNYFERWYAAVWQKHINTRMAAPGAIEAAMQEELAWYNATLSHKDNGYRFVVTFNDDAEYTLFALKWS